MKKKELMERLARANELVLKQDKVFGMVRLENQMLIKTIHSQKKELKQGQENYRKLWDMYSELKKENDDCRKKHNIQNPFDRLPSVFNKKGE